ncbi:hypothetical protein BLOT_015910 [Blomia tropicalis]|nr:hypothetical protein BLOT_015910 [Blomia tropicalis]
METKSMFRLNNPHSCASFIHTPNVHLINRHKTSSSTDPKLYVLLSEREGQLSIAVDLRFSSEKSNSFGQKPRDSHLLTTSRVTTSSWPEDMIIAMS